MNIDSDILLFLLIGLFIIFFAGVIFLSYWKEKQRREALQEFAHSMGYEYTANDPALSTSLTSNLAFHLLRQGHGRRAFNILRGHRSGVDFLTFDYKYTVGSGKNSHTYQQTATLLTIQQANLAHFFIRPAHFFDRVAVKFGQQDIDFPDRPEFTKKYRITGEDENVIRQVFTDSLISFFESQDKLCVETAPSQILLYISGKRKNPEELQSHLESAVQLSGLLFRPGPAFEGYDFGTNR